MNPSLLDQMRREYEFISKEFQDLKTRLLELIEYEELDILNTYDITQLQDYGREKSILFWKIKCAEIDMELSRIRDDHPDEDYPVEYYRLCAKKYECYDNQLRVEKDEFTYNRYHKPVIQHKIMSFKSRAKNLKSFQERCLV